MKFIYILTFLFVNNYSAHTMLDVVEKEKEIQIIDSLQDQFSHLECISNCKDYLLKEPAESYVNNVLCYEYNKIKAFDSCIIVGNVFNKTNNYPLDNYFAIFNAYIEKEDFVGAIEISKISIAHNKNIKEAKKNINAVKFKIYFSTILSFALSIMIIYLYIFYLINKKDIRKKIKLNFIENFFIILIISFLIYLVFFYFSDFIWSQNLNISPSKFTRLVKIEIYDKDGIESFVLYLIGIISVGIMFLLSKFQFNSIKSHFVFIFFFLTLIFINYIGIYPPLLSIGEFHQIVLVLFFIIALLLILNFLYKKNIKIFYLLFITLLFVICFRSVGAISVIDNSIILFPALEIINGHPISQIYFQYDLFLTLIGYFYLKFGINLDLIQLPFQFSYLLFFLVLFIFTKRFFFIKINSVYIFLIILVIKYYSYSHEPTYAFGQTPLRIDLWIIPLFLSVFFGIRHWSVALVLGLMLLFHKNLGIIYTVSYLMVMLMLFVLDIKKIQLINFLKIIKLHLSLNLTIILSLIFSIFSIFLVFGGFVPESAVMFSRLGINFLKISEHSIYWFIFPMYSLVAFLLLNNIKLVSKEYFSISFFVIFLAIGNSMYFFGRSHDSQFVQILPLPIIVFFILLDLIYKFQIISSLSKIKFISFSFLIIIALIYSTNIYEKGLLQVVNYKKGRVFYSITSSPSINDFNTIKKLTGNSEKVAFLYCGKKRSADDLLFYLKGNYKLHSGKPLLLEVFAANLRGRIQELTSEGYYVVTSTPYYLYPILPGILDLKSKKIGRYTAYYK